MAYQFRIPTLTPEIYRALTEACDLMEMSQWGVVMAALIRLDQALYEKDPELTPIVDRLLRECPLAQPPAPRSEIPRGSGEGFLKRHQSA